MYYDPKAKRSITIEEEDGLIVVKEMIPKEALTQFMDHNKKLYNAVPHKQYKSALRKKTMWQAASIPTIIIEKWKKEEGIDIFNDDHWPRVQAKLNSSEYQFLRTSPGKV
jgi:hypothetical protein